MIAAQGFPLERTKSPRLFARLRASVSAEALDASRVLTVDLIEATLGARDLHRTARIIVLLYLAAAAAQRDDAGRERRWRRFINVLSPLAVQTGSTRLFALVRENADLLEQKNVPDFV